MEDAGFGLEGGFTPFVGVTDLEGLDGKPEPLAFDATTINV